MSWEKVGSNRSKRRNGKSAKRHSDTDAQIRILMETHKTEPCDRTDNFHDIRLCDKYHPLLEDKRRNPYLTFYSPDEETCLNQYEVMYHPIVFRTAFCQKGSNCIYGKTCARAHSSEQLRDRTKSTNDYYNDSLQLVRQKQSLASVLDLSSISRVKPNFSDLARKAWKERHISPTNRSMKIPEHLWFAVNKSNELFHQIQEAAIEEGLGTVHRGIVNQLTIRGVNLSDIVGCIKSLLDEPSLYFASRILSYGERIITSLRGLETSEISKSKNLLVQFLPDGKLRMTAVRTKKQAVNDLLDNEIAKLDFWIKREKYDDFHSCGCCFDEFNIDQGIMCENGHFYCSSSEDEGNECFAMLAKSQFLHLSSRTDNSLLCPECNAPYGSKSVASNLSTDDFDEYQGAIVDAKVTKKADEMNASFNQRLQAAVAEVLETYGNAESRLLLEAKKLAKEARDTILNLRCPHCKAAYVDFSGCMAIACERCKGNFCAYCHQKTTTARGAHEHVRQCLMNETDDGSYYATAEQIHDAQRRYRTREIKTFLKKHKKNLQNAIVIELKKDLDELDVKQEALFELGNLM